MLHIYKWHLTFVTVIVINHVLYTADQQYQLLVGNAPSVPLVKLLKVTNVMHDNSLETVIKGTQQNWLREKGQLRCNVQDKYKDKAKIVMPLLKEIGVITEVVPTKQAYDYLFIHGGILADMVHRMATVKRLLELCQFGSLVVLSGERKLDLDHESREKIIEVTNDCNIYSAKFLSERSIKTEYDLCCVLFMLLRKQKEWQGVPYVLITDEGAFDDKKGVKKVDFVNIPHNKNPCTYTTLKFWLQARPDCKGSCLAVSNQPYIGYQDVHAKHVLSEKLEVETVGATAYEQNISVHLDNIARWLYIHQHKE